MVSARVHTAADLCVIIGELKPGTHLPLSCWQKGTRGLFLATDEHLLYVLLVHAIALRQHSFLL